MELESPPRTPPAHSRFLARLLDSLERDWLGLTHGPWSHCASDAGWTPDEPGEYCSRCGGDIGAHETGLARADDTPEIRPADEPDSHVTEMSAAGAASSAGAAGAHAGLPVAGAALSGSSAVHASTACAACRNARVAWERFVRLGAYADVLRDAIHDLKFHAWRRRGGELGTLLGIALRDALLGAGVDPAQVIVVPVPTTFRRRLARGIDHSLVLARAVRSVLGARVLMALRRTHRPSQVALALTQRRRNVRGTMRLSRAGRRAMSKLSGRTIVVVDDVRTTGATLTEAARALTEPWRGRAGRADLPPRVWVATLAVTPRA